MQRSYSSKVTVFSMNSWNATASECQSSLIGQSGFLDKPKSEVTCQLQCIFSALWRYLLLLWRWLDLLANGVSLFLRQKSKVNSNYLIATVPGNFSMSVVSNTSRRKLKSKWKSVQSALNLNQFKLCPRFVRKKARETNSQRAGQRGHSETQDGSGTKSTEIKNSKPDQIRKLKNEKLSLKPNMIRRPQEPRKPSCWPHIFEIFWVQHFLGDFLKPNPCLFTDRLVPSTLNPSSALAAPITVPKRRLLCF